MTPIACGELSRWKAPPLSLPASPNRRPLDALNPLGLARFFLKKAFVRGQLALIYR